MGLTDKPSIIIIGAGVAGLSAGSYLHRNGWANVTILEAKDRIGGRTFTKPFGPCGIEIGGQWIHGEKNNPIFDIAKENNLVDNEAPNFMEAIKKGFVQLKSENEMAVSKELYELIEERLFTLKEDAEKWPNQQSIFENLRECLLEELPSLLTKTDSKTILALIDWNIRFQSHVGGANHLSDISVEDNYEWLEGNLLVEMQDHYSSVVDVINSDIPTEWFHMQSEVKQIKWKQTNLEVILADGSILTTDRVIVTIPLGVLKANHKTLFSPELPIKKQKAIESLGFGAVDKMFLVYDVPFWKEGEIFNVLWFDGKSYSGDVMNQDLKFDEDAEPKEPIENTWMRYIIYFSYVRHQDNVLCAWIHGRGAELMEKLSDEQVLDQCHKVLSMTLSRNDLTKPREIIRSTWAQDPFSRGSYSYTSVDCIEEKITHSDLEEPLSFKDQDGKEDLKVLFAGEATHSKYFSTVHGAYESGEREAKRLIQSYENSGIM